MGLFGIFSGKSPESHEQRGDEFMNIGAFGDALMEYEKALDKIDKRFPEKAHLKGRINDKHLNARNGLAKKHLENAEIMVKAREFADAGDLYQLALELAADSGLKRDIEKSMSLLSGGAPAAPVQPGGHAGNTVAHGDEDWEEDWDEDEAYEEELFSVLLSALPEELKDAYSSYGDAFVSGYVALNEGDFEAAAAYLEDAMEENSGPTLIPLELATALIHLEAYDEAVDLLETYVAQNPEQPRAYQLLCEIYWEKKEYDRAGRLLSNVPKSIADSKAILILQGENRIQNKEYDAAEAVFNDYEAIHGKDEIVTRALAKTYELSGRTQAAKALYADIINKCLSCATRPDPFLKRRYAELCYQDGETSKNLLDIYLGLAREDPDNRAVYFSRVSSIFFKKKEFGEAERYDALAKQSEP